MPATRPERARLLRELRARQTRAMAALTPAERIARANALLTFARSVSPRHATSDEPVSLLLAQKAKWRSLREP